MICTFNSDFKTFKPFLLFLVIISIFDDLIHVVRLVNGDSESDHHFIVNKYFSRRRNWYLSNLGRILFMDVDKEMYTDHTRNRSYVIHIDEYSWSKLLMRHSFKEANRKMLVMSFFSCSVLNCVFVRGHTHLSKVDAVLVDITAATLPNTRQRTMKQRWILLSEVPPVFMPENIRPYYKLRNMGDIFNWTMTYRSDADIPIPFGRTVALPKPNWVYLGNPESALSKLVPFWQEKQSIVPAVTIIANCKIEARIDFLTKLMKHLKVEVIGPCFDDNLGCLNHPTTDCPILKDYFFYLALENCNCRQYLTQNVFHNAYSKGAIPVIMGPPVEDCQKLLPPDSFIYVEDYKTAEELAIEIKAIVRNPDLMLRLHMWRMNFEVVDEFGFVGNLSPLFCRVCEALNFNDSGEKSYNNDELNLFTDKKISCNTSYV